ncbi:MAG: 7-carboxy-7-deazaguanine synthase QueE [candidate division WOR-3 bacterium]|nr:7-carboxy-7-deazaguanine synthase QueE [candidate division WOR-3 bacterium]
MGGYIREIFTSIQGEGIRVGQRMAFVRFLGCNLSCNYCDVPECQKKDGPFLYNRKIYPNPVGLDFILDKITEPVVAITGGEPLLQPLFLLDLCNELKKMNRIIYLETNGTLPGAFEMVAGKVDIVALDFKIPSATGRPGMWKKHEEILKLAAKKEVFVKMVINENLIPRELEYTVSIIEKVDKNIPLVIQPVFGRRISNLLDIQKKAMERLKDVRIIPQVHKYLKLE